MTTRYSGVEGNEGRREKEKRRKKGSLEGGEESTIMRKRNQKEKGIR